jgi:coenzyme F420-dependent glucose-6-phosphate dehydrogenase
MVELGYTLSSEEEPPDNLVRYAQRAEQAGFAFCLISDHYHPWVAQQGQSPFAWSTLGGVAYATQRLRAGTGVTCPLLRYHPAIVAQAAATVAMMMPERFFLGLGTGENLNEHVVGRRWPPASVRREMLEEAVGIIRRLWQGDLVDHRGRHYTVDHARLYTAPAPPPPIMIAASSRATAEVAGRLGDGLISTVPEQSIVRTFESAGGKGKPRYGQVHVCWAANAADGRRTAHRRWPIAAMPGPIMANLPHPAHFEATARLVGEDDVARQVPCGPDAEHHMAAIKKFHDAGFTHVYVHQIGPDQEGFFRFYEQEILPRVGTVAPPAGRRRTDTAVRPRGR